MMPIIVEYLTLWDICFRWYGLDPRRFYFRIPYEVDDLARTFLVAVHNADLACDNITLEKRLFEKDEVKESFYYWKDDFCNAYDPSKRLNRKLLKWAVIERHDFKLWCERMNAPLPEFWFPRDWNLEYELLENEFPPGLMYSLDHWTKEERKAYFLNLTEQENNKGVLADIKSRPNQIAKVTAQTVAINLWKEFPRMTIAEMIVRTEIQDLCGAKSYTPEVIRRWLSDVAPSEVKERRGRPKKITPPNEKSQNS